MKINDSLNLMKTNGYTKKQIAQSKEISRNQEHDTVEISQKTKDLIEIQTLRTERLEQIKKGIAEGTYHVDSKKIAEKLFLYL